MSRVTIGGKAYPLEEFNGRKQLRATKLLVAAGPAWAAIVDAYYDARQEFGQRHFELLDRNTARARHGPEPMLEPVLVRNEQGEPVLDEAGAPTVLRDAEDNPVLQPARDRETGEWLMGPDPLGHLAPEDWAAMDQQLKVPLNAKFRELLPYVIPVALDKAERQVLRLLALVFITNAELEEASRADSGEIAEGEGITDLLDRKAEWILDESQGAELFELAAAAAEMLERQFSESVGKLTASFLRARGLVDSILGRETTATTSSEIPVTETSSSTSGPTGPTSSPEATETDGTSPEPSTARPGEPSPEPSPA